MQGWDGSPHSYHDMAIPGVVTPGRGPIVYPFDLCNAILLGCRRQLVEDYRLVLGIVGIQRHEENMSERQLLYIAQRHFEDFGDVEPFAAATGEAQFVDSVTGRPLKAELVLAARRKELSTDKVLPNTREFAPNTKGRLQNTENYCQTQENYCRTRKNFCRTQKNYYISQKHDRTHNYCRTRQN